MYCWARWHSNHWKNTGFYFYGCPLRLTWQQKRREGRTCWQLRLGWGLASLPPPFGREEVGGRPGCCSAPDLGQVTWLLDPSKPIRNAEAWFFQVLGPDLRAAPPGHPELCRCVHTDLQLLEEKARPLPRGSLGRREWQVDKHLELKYRRTLELLQVQSRPPQ